MKKKSSISFGPGAASLLLIFVVLAMSVLGMLSLMNSRNDVRLSERSVAVMEAVYILNSKAEETRAKVDAVLAGLSEYQGDADGYLAAASEAFPEEMKVDGSVISWDETDGARTIHCALEVMPSGSSQRTRWVRHTLIVKTAEEGNYFDPAAFQGLDDAEWDTEESFETEEEWIIDD